MARTIDEVLADLEAAAVNCDNGWRAEPPTIAALLRRAARDISEGLERVREDERAAMAKEHWL